MTDFAEAGAFVAPAAPALTGGPIDPPGPDSVLWWTIPDLDKTLRGVDAFRVAPALQDEHGTYSELARDQRDVASSWIVIACRGEAQGVVAERPRLVLAMSAGLHLARRFRVPCDVLPVT